MNLLVSFSLATLSSLLLGCFAAPSQVPKTVVTPGGPEDVRITKDNTINGTAPKWNPKFWPLAQPGLSVDFINNYAGDVNAYVTASVDGKVAILSQGAWYYPTTSSTDVPDPIDEVPTAIPLGGQGSTTSITIPNYFISARIYFAAGELNFYVLSSQDGNTITLVQPDPLNPSDPSAAAYWGFAEMTYTQDGGLYADVSFVDFLGMPLGQALTTTDGSPTQTVLGADANAPSSVCSALTSCAGQEGQPWDQLCQYRSDGTVLRANAPGKWIAVHGDAFSDYYSSYVDSVWSRFSTETLTLETSTNGAVSCSTASGVLTCEGANRSFDKPPALDIFGCQGQFGKVAGDNTIVDQAVARICAAFNRATLLLEGGEIQPNLGEEYYYTVTPSNRYSQEVHAHEQDGKGYAFPYDDVNPANAPSNADGTVASGSPAVWTLTVGGQ